MIGNWTKLVETGRELVFFNSLEVTPLFSSRLDASSLFLPHELTSGVNQVSLQLPFQSKNYKTKHLNSIYI